MRRAPPPSWAELAYRQYYANLAAWPSQPYPPAVNTDLSDAAGPAPLDAPPGKRLLVARSSHSSTGFEGTAEALLSLASTASGEDSSRVVLTGASARQEQLAAEALAAISNAYSLVPSTEAMTTPNTIGINGAVPPNALQQRFHALVMCNFTPRSPSELPRPQWVTYKTLFHLFQPHAQDEVWQMGPGNLKQLIVAWYKSHPAFAGLEVDRWCTRFEAPPGKGYIFKFCFEHTPR